MMINKEKDKKSHFVRYSETYSIWITFGLQPRVFHCERNEIDISICHRRVVTSI